MVGFENEGNCRAAETMDLALLSVSYSNTLVVPFEINFYTHACCE
jgi:hypothetical protein